MGGFLSFTGARAKGEVRRFSDMASDMVGVCIYHGIHFRFGDEADRDQSRQVAVGHRTRCGRAMTKPPCADKSNTLNAS
jgi:hypothetical protein